MAVIVKLLSPLTGQMGGNWRGLAVVCLVMISGVVSLSVVSNEEERVLEKMDGEGEAVPNQRDERGNKKQYMW